MKTLLAVLALGAGISAQAPQIRVEAPDTGSTIPFYGWSVAGLANDGGDGLGNFAVGAHSVGPAGTVYVHDGTTGDLLQSISVPLSGSTVAFFGRAIASVPDASGDGNDDVLVGARRQNVNGRAYLFAQPTAAGQPQQLLQTFVPPVLLGTGTFGRRVAGVGDLDADGLGDVLVSAVNAATSTPGEVYAFSSATGAVIHTFTDPDAVADEWFGEALAAVPDTNGDGIDEIAIGGLGEVYLYSGGDGSLLWSRSDGAGFFNPGIGQDLDGIDDIDGDGRGDLVVAAPGFAGVGRAFVFSGLDGSTLREFESQVATPLLAFASSVASAGDVDRDGVADVLVGSPNETLPGNPIRGRTYLFSGADASLLSVARPAVPAPDLLVSDDASFGFDVDGLPDADGDGAADYIVGSPLDPNPSGPFTDFTGAAYAFFCTTETDAAATVRTGSPPNPVALTSQTPPVIGSTWQLGFGAGALVPSPTQRFLAVGLLPGNVPTGKGTVLFDGLVVLLTVPPGPLAFPLPGDCSLVGVSFVMQAAAANATETKLGNALDVVLGSYDG